MRSLIAEHPWADSDTTVCRLFNEWHSSFPSATAIRLASPTLTKAHLGQLSGLTRFTIEGFHSKVPGNELPLAVVRTMPGLTALTVCDRKSVSGRRAASVTASHSERAAALALVPTAPVWGELGQLRELSLTLPLTALPATLLSRLSVGLRVLCLNVIPPPATAEGGGSFVLTDAALAGLPLLEELTLCRVATWSDVTAAPDFSGACLATLSRLKTLALTHSHLPPLILKHACPALRSLSLAHCTGLTSETLTSIPTAVLAGIRTLNLRDAPPAVTSVAFAGLTGLEDLDVSCNLQPSLLSEPLLRVLGSMGRLRRLCGHADTFMDPKSRTLYRGGGLQALASCPLVELDLLGPGHYYLPNARDTSALKSLRVLRLGCKELHGGTFLASLPLLETLDLTHYNGPLAPATFSALRSLRSLNLSKAKHVSRELLCALPPTLEELLLDHCEQNVFDDPLLESLGKALPHLSTLSLHRTLHSETSGYGSRFTTAAGWAALLRELPRGLFRLDVSGCSLSFASYSLLREHVAELEADKVKSPEEEVASTKRRGALAASRAAKLEDS